MRGSALVALSFLVVYGLALTWEDAIPLNLAVNAPPTLSPDNWNTTQLSAPCERQLAAISLEDPLSYRTSG